MALIHTRTLFCILLLLTKLKLTQYLCITQLRDLGQATGVAETLKQYRVLGLPMYSLNDACVVSTDLDVDRQHHLLVLAVMTCNSIHSLRYKLQHKVQIDFIFLSTTHTHTAYTALLYVEAQYTAQSFMPCCTATHLHSHRLTNVATVLKSYTHTCTHAPHLCCKSKSHSRPVLSPYLWYLPCLHLSRKRNVASLCSDDPVSS